jgi:hypothetical protein
VIAGELWVPELRKLPPGQQAVVWQSEPGYIGPDTYDVLTQLDLMAQLAGFELESRQADWQGGEFTADSTSHVSVCRLGPAE